MSDFDADLLVVGGGPGGLATALHARRQGLSVIVAEPREGPIDKACGEGLMPGGLAELTALGVDPAGRSYLLTRGGGTVCLHVQAGGADLRVACGDRATVRERGLWVRFDQAGGTRSVLTSGSSLPALAPFKIWMAAFGTAAATSGACACGGCPCGVAAGAGSGGAGLMPPGRMSMVFW